MLFALNHAGAGDEKEISATDPDRVDLERSGHRVLRGIALVSASWTAVPSGSELGISETLSVWWMSSRISCALASASTLTEKQTFCARTGSPAQSAVTFTSTFCTRNPRFAASR